MGEESQTEGTAVAKALRQKHAWRGGGVAGVGGWGGGEWWYLNLPPAPPLAFLVPKMETHTGGHRARSNLGHISSGPQSVREIKSQLPTFKNQEISS